MNVWNNLNTKFAKKFKQRFGKDNESFGMYGYDATMVGIKAMEGWLKANPGKKPTRTDVSTAVRQLKGFKGVTGSIEFDNKGDPVKAKYFVLQFDKQSYPGKVVKIIDQQEQRSHNSKNQESRPLEGCSSSVMPTCMLLTAG